MRMIKLNSILSWDHLKEYRELSPKEYIEWDEAAAKSSKINLFFISHRWITPTHPDPKGEQLSEMQKRLADVVERRYRRKAFVFYDYASMIQRPRTPKEDQIFYKDISKLASLARIVDKTIILSEGYTDYRNRAWCFFEAIVAERKVHFFEDQQNIKSDLSFLDWLLDTGIKQITSYDLSYKTNANEAEIITAIFQHLKDCRLTHATDFPLIKSQMVAHLNNRRLSSFGRLVVALHKFFDVTFTIVVQKKGIDIPCKPYFQVPDWRPLPKLPGDVFLGDAGKPSSVFALPRHHIAEMEQHPEQGFLPALRLSMPGIENQMEYIQSFHTDPNWQDYVVNPIMLGEQKDSFPSVDYVIHTILERPPGFFSSKDFRYLYFYLVK